MADQSRKTHVYVGLAGEHPLAVGADPASLGEGGLYRRADGDEEWQKVNNGLPKDPQVRALAIHPEDPQMIYAGTQHGVYVSSDRGEHWEATDSHKGEVWSLAFHPSNPSILLAGHGFPPVLRCIRVP